MEERLDHARRKLIADRLYAGGDHMPSIRYQYCREPGRGWVGVCLSSPDHETVYHPESCGLRICPECARRRSAELSSQLEQPLIELERRAPRHYRLRHVVLTTGLDLAMDADELRQELRDLRVAAREVFQECFKNDKWLGGGIGAEFGDVGRKLHYHCLVLAPWLPAEKVKRLWREKTGGRFYVVHFRSDLDTTEAIREVTKYVTKPIKAGEDVEVAVNTIVKLHFVLKGVRRFVTFGSFYRLPRDIQEDVQVCPDCGGLLHWLPELEYVEVYGASNRNLIRANKSPPVQEKMSTKFASKGPILAQQDLPGMPGPPYPAKHHDSGSWS